MQDLNTKNKKLKRIETSMNMKQTLGLISLVATILLLGCAMQQSEKRRIVPNHSPDFLECVAEEYYTDKHGDCTKRAIDEWVVFSGY